MKKLLEPGILSKINSIFLISCAFDPQYYNIPAPISDGVFAFFVYFVAALNLLDIVKKLMEFFKK